MKGIRKLFFGIILVTLFGVGFRVDAKATPSLKLTKEGYDWDTTNWNDSTHLPDYVFVYLHTEPDDFPQLDLDNPKDVTYTYNCSITCNNTPIAGPVTVKLIHKKDGSKIVKIGKSEYTSGEHLLDALTLSKSMFRDRIVSAYKKEKSSDSYFEAIVNAVMTPTDDPTVDQENPSDTQTFNLYKIIANAYYNTNPLSAYNQSVTIDGAGKYLLDTDTAYLSITKEPASDYSFIKWTNGSESTVDKSSVADSSKSSCPVTADSKIESNPDMTYIVWFGKLTLTKEITSGTTVKAGGNLSGTYMLSGFPTGADIINFNTDDGATLASTSTMSSKNYSLDIDSDATAGLKTLNIIVGDTTDTDSYSTTFTHQFYVDSGEAIDLSHVYVNLGYDDEKLSIKLSEFIKNESDYRSVLAKISSDKASVSAGSSSATSLSQIKVIAQKSGTAEDSVVLSGPDGTKYATADLTVYAKPSISMTTTSSSSSSSSYTSSYKFTITMPKGDYHDNFKIENLTQAELVLVDSSGNEKSSEIVSLSSSKYSYSLSSSKVRDLFGSGSGKATLYAYAYDGDNGRDDKVYAKYEFGYDTGNSSSSSLPDSSTPGRNSSTEGDDYDDVPKTGESKADIWILWSVLFIAIIGAGFVIWKRFGLVRAIAEADEEIAAAEQTEKVEAEKKEKEDKIRMLKDLRNLK